MELDIRTLALFLGLMTLLQGIILFLFYRLFPDMPGPKYWAIAGLLQSIAAFLTMGRGALSPLLSIVASNGGYFLSYVFFYQGMRVFSGRSSEWRLPLIVFFIAWLPFWATFDSSHYLGFRILLNSGGVTIWALAMLWVLLKDIPESLPARRATGFIMAGVAVIGVVRFVSTLNNPPDVNNFMDSLSIGDQMIFVWGAAMSFVFTASVIVMTSEKLHHELKDKMEKLAAAKRDVERAMGEQKNFFTMISHEFRTPLGIISASADVVASNIDSSDTESDEELVRIQRASTRLAKLVESCLNDEWLLAAASKQAFLTFDVGRGLRRITEEYNVPLTIECTEPVWMKGDDQLFRVIISSLIDNACKYGKTLKAVAVDCHLAGDDTIVINVHDDGPGIPKEEASHIFEKYYRVMGGEKKAGAGLGLYFVKQVAERHDGDIELIQNGKTTFRLTLPLAKE